MTKIEREKKKGGGGSGPDDPNLSECTPCFFSFSPMTYLTSGSWPCRAMPCSRCRLAVSLSFAWCWCWCWASITISQTSKHSHDGASAALVVAQYRWTEEGAVLGEKKGGGDELGGKEGGREGKCRSKIVVSFDNRFLPG